MGTFDPTGTIPGITSAYAEKRVLGVLIVDGSGNYLRIRGEETKPHSESLPMPELPPHTRRRVSWEYRHWGSPGITSAYAEKSPFGCERGLWPGNYLRIRGEESIWLRAWSMAWELPPHTRRRVCVTCENFNGQRRFVTLQPIRSRVTTCRPSLLYFCAVAQGCSQRILALYWNRY